MKKSNRYVGLDVHADSIAVAVAEEGRDGEVRSLGTIANQPEAIRKLMQRLGPTKTLKVCYEAGPTGFVVYRQLLKLGVDCAVIAPSLIPKKPGDHVKTDRRDAIKLARCYRAGDLTPVWVPDAEHEALRDLVRAREAAKKDQTRARQRLAKLLLRNGRRNALKSDWSRRHLDWIRTQQFAYSAQQATFVDYLAEVDHATARLDRLDAAIDDAVKVADPVTQVVIERLQAFRGIAKLTAATLVAEVGRFSRFEKAGQAMSWAGMTPREFSSGGPNKRRLGGITKSGNSHLRRILVESAWAYRHRPSAGKLLRQRQRSLPAPVNEIAWKAQHRLHKRYVTLTARGKPTTKAATVVARELLGFVWAVAKQIEHSMEAAKTAAA